MRKILEQGRRPESTRPNNIFFGFKLPCRRVFQQPAGCASGVISQPAGQDPIATRLRIGKIKCMETLFQNQGNETSAKPQIHQYSESKSATAIERQTARLPSDAFLYAAGGSIVASLTLKIMGRHKDALFVGQWASPLLVLGLYNKLVKLFGTDPRRG